MNNTSNKYFYEAEQICNYLLSHPIKESEKTTYAEAMKILDIQLSPSEEKIWNIMLKSKQNMACIDAAFAIQDSNNNVRRKLYTMLAILETSPHYTAYFLPLKFNGLGYIKIIGIVIRSVFRLIVGMCMLKIVSLKCR